MQTCHSSLFNLDTPIFQCKSRSTPISRFHVWKSRVCLVSKLEKQKGVSLCCMARVSKPTKFGLKINVMIGWILCTLRLSEWSRLWPCLSFLSPRTRPYMMPLFRWSEEFRWFWRIIPSFLDSSHFSSVCSDLGRGNRESGKSEIIIQRNSKINEAKKLINNFISAKQLFIAV